MCGWSIGTIPDNIKSCTIGKPNMELLPFYYYPFFKHRLGGNTTNELHYQICSTAHNLEECSKFKTIDDINEFIRKDIIEFYKDRKKLKKLEWKRNK